MVTIGIIILFLVLFLATMVNIFLEVNGYFLLWTIVVFGLFAKRGLGLLTLRHVGKEVLEFVGHMRIRGLVVVVAVVFLSVTSTTAASAYIIFVVFSRLFLVWVVIGILAWLVILVLLRCPKLELTGVRCSCLNIEYIWRFSTLASSFSVTDSIYMMDGGRPVAHHACDSVAYSGWDFIPLRIHFAVSASSSIPGNWAATILARCSRCHVNKLETF